MDGSIPLPSLLRVPPLRGDENIAKWNSKLVMSLDYLGCSQYIEKIIPEPTILDEDGQEDPIATRKARDTHKKEMMTAYLSIRQSIDPVLTRLTSAGWEDPDRTYNAKRLYDLIHKIIPKISRDSENDLMAEMFQLSLDNYGGSIRKMLDRFTWLWKRLEEIDVVVGEKQARFHLLNALRPYNSQWVDLIEWSVKYNGLSFDNILTDVSERANTQANDMALLNVKSG